MKIKNYQLPKFIELLTDLSLKGKSSRKRTSFLRILVDAYQEFLLEEQKLKEEYAIKNEFGKIIFKDENKTTFEVTIDFRDEHRILLEEEFIFEVNDKNKDMLLTVAEILLDGEFEVSGETATYYDEWCEELEKVIERYSEIN